MASIGELPRRLIGALGGKRRAWTIFLFACVWALAGSDSGAVGWGAGS